MTRRGTGSLVASPVLVGAVTVLVTIIAVFIAYNANAGLPFVPTYDIKAELPTGGKLVKGNEVRVGGFRVGVVDDIRPKTVRVGREGRSIAVVDLKLDKKVEPLAIDSKAQVRPRSVLGLKYLDIRPGNSKSKFQPGDTIPLRNTSEPLELEDVLSTFDEETRPNVRRATTGFGDAFAGRGASLNEAIRALNPLFRHLTPVMRNLADPQTRLNNLFRQLGRAAAQAAPVARTQAVLFTHMADTFAAISRDPAALQATIAESPPTLDVAIRSFRVQRPFLADFADLSRRLRPAVQELTRSLPAINSALRVGTPVLRRSPELNRRIESLNEALEDLFERPSTLRALRQLRTTLRVAKPAVQFIVPYQTVCNYWVYWWNGLGEHMTRITAEGGAGGTNQNQGVKLPNLGQPNSYITTEGSRPIDISRDHEQEHGDDAPITPTGQPGPERAEHRFYTPIYQPAIDAQGNADCQLGQVGYIRGPLNEPGLRYGRDAQGNPTYLSDDTPSGGNFAVLMSNLPGLRGGTFVSRELGIRNLRDVP
jgi:virulence factor Mce-like protein